jgi:hypothetical protein
MEKRTQRAVIGSLMIALGLFQVGWGLLQTAVVYAGLGLFYAALGGLYLWAEVYRVDWDGTSSSG